MPTVTLLRGSDWRFRVMGKRLRFVVYRVADPGWSASWNTYYKGEPWESRIGYAVVLWRWCVSLLWGTPTSPSEWIRAGSPDDGGEG